MNPQRPFSDITPPTPDGGALKQQQQQDPTTPTLSVAENIQSQPTPESTPQLAQVARSLAIPIAKATAPQPKIAPAIPNQPLVASPIETPRPKVKNGVSWLRDLVGLAIFVIVIIVGAYLINSFIFRSFNVVGPSMEPTLEGGTQGSIEGAPSDRLIVNRLPVTIAHITGKDYIPARGQIIVFENPVWTPVMGETDKFVVKRVIGLPDERVTVSDCTLKVYNDEHPDGFNPYPDFKNLAANDSEVNNCVGGDGTDVIVPSGQIFVVGDHRVGDMYSMDSRNGDGRPSLGTIPLKNIVGPVSLRIWPLNQLKAF